ncbi:transposase [Tessaracoccus lubricantis]|uniref:Transposase n=1 Tax=Tessaracoccus lubricantis TaxID=545543 RepID=A0ABP9FKH0_9ACTN
MSGNNTSRRYPAELKARAVRMYREIRSDHDTDWAAMAKVAELLGIGTTETLRKWVRQAEIDQGDRPGVTSEESAEIKRLKRENAELKRANAILKAASPFFASMPRLRCPAGLAPFFAA